MSDSLFGALCVTMLVVSGGLLVAAWGLCNRAQGYLDAVRDIFGVDQDAS